jgi:hypothetical protein
MRTEHITGIYFEAILPLLESSTSVIGRKNWLFSATPRGVKASSVIYPIIETAKANFLKPFEYLWGRKDPVRSRR